MQIGIVQLYKEACTARGVDIIVSVESRDNRWADESATVMWCVRWNDDAHAVHGLGLVII